MNIAFVAGKSGGHIIPALTLAEKSQQDGDTVYMITHDYSLDRLLCSKTSAFDDILLLTLRSGDWRKFWYYPVYLYDMFWATMQCYHFLREGDVEQVISMGGYISLAVVIAARFLNIPIIMYELNAVPGVAVKTLLPFVHEVRYCFPAAQQYFTDVHYAYHVAYPIRYTYQDIKPAQRIREHLSIPCDHYVVVVVGGSQGSEYLNRMVTMWVSSLCVVQQRRLYVIHQTGSAAACEQVQKTYDQQGIASVVGAFFDDMAPYYCVADRVITRAGSGVLHEIAFFGRSSLIVPLETAHNSHQVDNAQAFAAMYPATALVVRQADRDIFMKTMTCLLEE